VPLCWTKISDRGEKKMQSIKAKAKKDKINSTSSNSQIVCSSKETAGSWHGETCQ
jgi:hypothetical protein